MTEKCAIEVKARYVNLKMDTTNYLIRSVGES